MRRIWAGAVFLAMAGAGGWIAHQLIDRGSEVVSGSGSLEIFKETYYVPPDFSSRRSAFARWFEKNVWGPFAAGGGAGLRGKETVKEVLIAQGVTFPEGTRVYTGLPYSGFTMDNTKANHRRVEAFLDRIAPGEWSTRSDGRPDSAQSEIGEPNDSDNRPPDPFAPSGG